MNKSNIKPDLKTRYRTEIVFRMSSPKKRSKGSQGTQTYDAQGHCVKISVYLETTV